MWRTRLIIVLMLVGIAAIPRDTSYASTGGTTSVNMAAGYNLFTNYVSCPGLPSGQDCTVTSPKYDKLFFDLTNIPCCQPPSGLVGRPIQLLAFQCAHYTTTNGITTGQVGIVTVDPYGVVGRFTPDSSAGILSRDTASTWRTDASSIAFMNVQGTFTAPSVTADFTIRSVEVVNNTTNTGIRGFVSATVTGTLFDVSYHGGTYTVTGYSQGTVTCLARPTPWSHGQGWGAFNQVAP